MSWSCYNNCIKFANLCCLIKKWCFILFVFIILGHIEVVKLLVTHTAEVTCKDKKSYTPLHAAASSGMISVVKYLLDLGVDVRKNKTKWEIIFLIVWNAPVSTVAHYLFRDELWYSESMWMKISGNTTFSFINPHFSIKRKPP